MYLYAVLPRAVSVAVHGIDDRPVRWVVDEDLAAAVSQVPATDFDEAPLNERIHDLRWLEPRAVAHQAVNAHLHEHSPAMLPVAFGAVFRSDDRVHELLRDEGPALRERLAAVAGRSEWVLSVHRRQDAALASVEASPALRALQAEVEAASPGRAHLLRRRLAEVRQQELGRVKAEIEGRLSAALADLADAVYPEPLPAQATERPLWRASLLVARTREAELVRVLDELRSELEPRGYSLLLTGPWPPYRFGGLEPRQVHARAV